MSAVKAIRQFILLVAVTIAIAACDGSPADRGPYLQSPTPTSVIIKWRTKTQLASEVHYGLAPGVLEKITETGVIANNHEVLLESLEPDTRYFYSVSGKERKEFYFRTPPIEGEAHSTRVWVLGDSGSGDERAEKVRDAFYEFNNGADADLILMLGDLAYDLGSETDFQRAFFEMYPDTLPTTPIFPALGNHDANTDRGAPYFGIFSLPASGESGGVASETEAYYSFNYANIHFVALDTELSDRLPGSTMYRWLIEDLKANDQDWTIVFFHRPLYSKGRHDSDDTGSTMSQMRMHYPPVFETYGVDLVFSGHNHSYERSFPLAGHQGTSDTLTESMKTDLGDGRTDGDGPYRKTGSGENEGVIYIVAGSSSKAHEYPLDHPANLIAMVELGSVVLDIDGDTLNARFVSPNSKAIDYFTIVKNQE